MNRKKLSLRTESLHELGAGELAGLAGAAPTYNCFISHGEPRCVPTVSSGCPFTGDPCVLTGTPSTEVVCS